MTNSSARLPLKGSVLGVILHDVCEEIKLEDCATFSGLEGPNRVLNMPLRST